MLQYFDHMMMNWKRDPLIWVWEVALILGLDGLISLMILKLVLLVLSCGSLGLFCSKAMMIMVV